MSKIEVDEIVNQTGDNDSGLDLSTNDVVAVKTANTERMRVDASGNVGIGTTSSPSHGTADNHFLAISGKQNNGSGVLAFIDTAGNSDALLIGDNGSLTINVDSSNATASSTLQFRVDNSERMRVDSSGNLLVGKTATGTSNTGLQFEPSGTGVFSRSGDICMVLNRETNGGECVSIRQGGTAVGGIDANSSSVDFNTSSDYRLKENVTTSWDATTRLKQLKPVRFSWKIDSKSEADTDGFLAHEVSSVVPQAISGEKDAVDADGNPKHQGIDHSKLVALLTKAVQELTAKVETLEAKVTALEGK